MQLSMTPAVQIAVDPEISIGQFGAALAAAGFQLSARGGMLLIAQGEPPRPAAKKSQRARQPKRRRQAAIRQALS
jgi:hypothetical protein